MLRPMGLPEDVNVIAWGLSLERPTMIHYGLSNIRDLFGHKVALSSTKNNKICYIVPGEEDKPDELDGIADKMADLAGDMLGGFESD